MKRKRKPKLRNMPSISVSAETDIINERNTSFAQWCNEMDSWVQELRSGI